MNPAADDALSVRAEPPPAFDEEASESESEPVAATYVKGLDAAITRSAAAMASLPKTRLSELVELIHMPFDSTVTAEFNSATYAQVIWLLCRVKPGVKISDLRVGTYRELGQLLDKAKQRFVSSMGASKFDDKVVVPLGACPSNELVAQIALEQGFRMEWLEKKVAAKAKSAPQQQQLLLPFVRPVVAAPGTTALVSAAAFAAATPATPVAAAPPAAATFAAASPVVAVPATVASATFLAAPGAPSAGARGLASGAAPGDVATAMHPDIMRQAMTLWLQQNPQMTQAGPVVSFTNNVFGELVEPAGEAPAGEQAPVPEGPVPDAAICAICQSAIGATSEYGDSEALLCAHVYHAVCLDQYCSATGKTRANCCPFKCNESSFVTVAADGAAADGGDGAAGNGNVADAAAAPSAEEVAELAQLVQQYTSRAMEEMMG